jgi:hypothetical protein
MAAERKSVNRPSTIRGAGSRKLTNGQLAPYKSNGLLGGIAVDALVFEFMGLAMLALCIIVLAVPSQRRSSGRVRDY